MGRRRAALTTARTNNGTHKLGARAFGRSARASRQRYALFGDRKGDQFEVQHRLFAQRGARSRQAYGACRRRAVDIAFRRQASSFAGNWRTAFKRTQDARISLAGAGVREGQAEEAALRIKIEPRHLSLTDLEHGDCRYPYGGDEEGEAITFCGHARRNGSSYCTPHFHLSRNPIPPPELVVSTLLRLVGAA